MRTRHNNTHSGSSEHAITPATTHPQPPRRQQTNATARAFGAVLFVFVICSVFWLYSVEFHYLPSPRTAKRHMPPAVVAITQPIASVAAKLHESSSTRSLSVPATHRHVVLTFHFDSTSFGEPNYRALESLIGLYPDATFHALFPQSNHGVSYRLANVLPHVIFDKYHQLGYDIIDKICNVRNEAVTAGSRGSRFLRVLAASDDIPVWNKHTNYQAKANAQSKAPSHLVHFHRIAQLYATGGLFADFTTLHTARVPRTARGVWACTRCSLGGFLLGDWYDGYALYDRAMFADEEAVRLPLRPKKPGTAYRMFYESFPDWAAYPFEPESLVMAFPTPQDPVLGCVLDAYDEAASELAHWAAPERCPFDNVDVDTLMPPREERIDMRIRGDRPFRFSVEQRFAGRLDNATRRLYANEEHRRQSESVRCLLALMLQCAIDTANDGDSGDSASAADATDADVEWFAGDAKRVAADFDPTPTYRFKDKHLTADPTVKYDETVIERDLGASVIDSTPLRDAVSARAFAFWIGPHASTGHWLPPANSSLMAQWISRLRARSQSAAAPYVPIRLSPPGCDYGDHPPACRRGLSERLSDGPLTYTRPLDLVLARTRCAPNVILPGTRKGGSTFFWNVVRHHPQLVRMHRGPGWKEVGLYKPSGWRPDAVGDRARQVPFLEPGQPFITADFAVDNFVEGHAERKAHGENADMRVLVIFRDPVGRAISDMRFSNNAPSDRLNAAGESFLVKSAQCRQELRDHFGLTADAYVDREALLADKNATYHLPHLPALEPVAASGVVPYVAAPPGGKPYRPPHAKPIDLERFIAGMESPPCRKVMPDISWCVEGSLYFPQLLYWMRQFDERQLLVVILDMLHDATSTIHVRDEVLDFLGLCTVGSGDDAHQWYGSVRRNENHASSRERMDPLIELRVREEMQIWTEWLYELLGIRVTSWDEKLRALQTRFANVTVSTTSTA